MIPSDPFTTSAITHLSGPYVLQAPGIRACLSELIRPLVDCGPRFRISEATRATKIATKESNKREQQRRNVAL
jgi:hypothetical protein